MNPQESVPTPPAQEPKPKHRLSWLRAPRLPRIGNVNWKVIALAGAMVVALNILLREALNDAYQVVPFEVPEALSKQGYNGQVVASRLADAIQRIQFDASPIRPGQRVSAWGGQDVKLELAGVGIGLRSISQYVAELVGVQRKQIGGELTWQAGRIELNLRVSGIAPNAVTVSLQQDDWNLAMDSLVTEGAKRVMRWVDPLTLSRYYMLQAVFFNNLNHLVTARELIRLARLRFPADSLWIGYQEVLCQEENQADIFIKKHPHFIGSYYLKGMELMNLKSDRWAERESNIRKSIPYFQMVCSMQADFPHAYSELFRGFAYLNMDRQRDSVEAIIKNKFYQDIEPIWALCIFYTFVNFNKEKVIELASQLEKLHIQRGETEFVETCLLTLYGYLGEYDKALNLKINRSYRGHAFFLIPCYLGKGQFDKAHALIKKLNVTGGNLHYFRNIEVGFKGDTTAFLSKIHWALKYAAEVQLGPQTVARQGPHYLQVKPYALYARNSQYLALLRSYGMAVDSLQAAMAK